MYENVQAGFFIRGNLSAHPQAKIIDLGINPLEVSMEQLGSF